MIVWGGDNGSSPFFNTGGLYDPVGNSWVAGGASTSGAPADRTIHTAVWTGSRMIVWGGSGDSSVLNSGGLYDPVGNSWAATATLGAPSGRTAHTSVWTGSTMIVWGGTSGSTTFNTGGQYTILSLFVKN
jgi:hypothetical protein